METESQSGKFLKDPVSVSDLMNYGSKFELDANYEEDLANEMRDECGLDENDDEQIKPEDIKSPWLQSFDSLRLEMQQVSPYIYKRTLKDGSSEIGAPPLNARVVIRYNAFLEFDSTPFDSSFLRSSSERFITGGEEVLPGLDQAVQTMKAGEEAEFVISYHLLFRELGCPPRIKPKADALFIIHLLSFTLVGDGNALDCVPKEDRDKYCIIIEKVKQIHLRGVDYFKQQQYKCALQCFEKAANFLQYSRTANKEEDAEKTDLLVKLYTNLAILYNKNEKYAKVCLMCKEVRQLTENNMPCKALFQEGRALFMLGEYVAAREILYRANRMEPNNVEICKELVELDKAFIAYKKNEKDLWCKAMGRKIEDEKISGELLDSQMAKLLLNFKESSQKNVLKLPKLPPQEYENLQTLAKHFQLSLTLDLNDICSVKK